MAGITLIYQQGQIDTSLLKRMEVALEKLPEMSILLRKKEFILLKKSKENYPVCLIEQPDYVLLVEGKIYDSDILKDEIFKTHIGGLLNPNKIDASIAYLRNLDGEFIIYLFDKLTGKMIVVNDFLGRLPVYYSQSVQFILGRDIGLIQFLTEKLEFNEQGIYEYMRLGYPLGERTLFANIYRLAPSSIIELDKGISAQSQSVSLEEWLESGRDVTKLEETLYELFKQAVKFRLDAFEKPLLSVSGGLDSRIIMGEIEKERQKVGYECFLYKNKIIEADVKVVELLCELYKTQFGVNELEEWSPDYFDELADAKYGMNYLGMAFIVPFLKRMAQKYDGMLTGDGGDKTLAYLFPDKQLFRKDIATQILRNQEVTSYQVCQDLFGFNTARNEETLRAHLNGYVYSNRNMNYKHFLIFERSKNWLFEGEDRNRQYIWSTTPFYHPKFFKIVHGMDEHEKKNFKLYSSFTKLINPELNNIANANWGFPIHQAGKLKNLLFKQQIKKQIKSLLPERKLNAPDEMLLATKAQLTGDFDGSLNLNRRIDVNELSKESLFHLMTLLKVAVNNGGKT